MDRSDTGMNVGSGTPLDGGVDRGVEAELSAIFRESPIAYRTEIARCLNSTNAAIFLSQILYWTPRASLGGGWVWKSAEEMEDETALSRRNQETARKILRDAGIVEESKRGIPPRMHYRVNKEALANLIRTTPRPITLRRKRTNQFGGNEQIKVAETTRRDGGNERRNTENTQETTAESTCREYVTGGTPVRDPFMSSTTMIRSTQPTIHPVSNDRIGGSSRLMNNGATAHSDDSATASPSPLACGASVQHNDPVSTVYPTHPPTVLTGIGEGEDDPLEGEATFPPRQFVLAVATEAAASEAPPNSARPPQPPTVAARADAPPARQDAAETALAADPALGGTSAAEPRPERPTAPTMTGLRAALQSRQAGPARATKGIAANKWRKLPMVDGRPTEPQHPLAIMRAWGYDAANWPQDKREDAIRLSAAMGHPVGVLWLAELDAPPARQDAAQTALPAGRGAQGRRDLSEAELAPGSPEGEALLVKNYLRTRRLDRLSPLLLGELRTLRDRYGLRLVLEVIAFSTVRRDAEGRLPSAVAMRTLCQEIVERAVNARAYFGISS